MNTLFWRGKRVFLTGHTGFKGSWLSLWLQNLGAELTGYALKAPTNPSLFEEARVADGMTTIEGDVRDLDFLSNSIKNARSEIVIHMAAQPLVRRSYIDPVETYSTNVMGTVNLLEAVRRSTTVRAVVNVTTDKCYQNNEWFWGYRENDPMGGFDPYSSSKGCAELVSTAYRNSYFNTSPKGKHHVLLATARAGNVIGGGDWSTDRLMPDILAAFASSRPVQIRSPQAIRPWQHVLEPLRGYMLLAEQIYSGKTHFAGAWNFGPNDEDTKCVEWIVERMAKLWGSGAKWTADTDQHPNEAGNLKLDSSKARILLNWQPILRIPEALEFIVEWSLARRAGSDVRELTLGQICNYQALCEHTNN
jgi:CDP-glucose 4,6-dehydratase